MMNHKLWATDVNLILVCTTDKDWKSVIYFVSSLCFQKRCHTCRMEIETCSSIIVLYYCFTISYLHLNMVWIGDNCKIND